ncbi:MAG: zf-HC2 domain-containing protein [Chloroflexi bacterium]|nr:zf-HC2 domain-containing protein [Chloroflexota bacterium]
MKDRLSLYLDGRLVPEEKAKVESHLKACAACREELESLRATVNALRQLPLVAPPRPFVLPAEGSRLAGAVRPALRPVAFYRLRLATAVVAALLVALVSWDSVGRFMGPVGQEPSRGPAPAASPQALQQASAPTPGPAAAPAAQAPVATPPPLSSPTPAPKTGPSPAPMMAPAAAPVPRPAPLATPSPTPDETQPRIMKAAPSGPAAATAQEAGGPVPPADAEASAQAMEQSRQVGTPQPSPATAPAVGVAPVPAQPVAPRSLQAQPLPPPPPSMPLAPPARDGASGPVEDTARRTGPAGPGAAPGKGGAAGVASVAPTPSPTPRSAQEELKVAPSAEPSAGAMDAVQAAPQSPPVGTSEALPQAPAQPPYSLGLGVREAEIALGALLAFLGAATIYAWRRARRQVRRKER